MAKQDHQAAQGTMHDPLAVGAADVDVVEEQVDDGLVEVTNLGSATVKFQLDGRTIKMPPKSKTRVQKAYGMLRAGANPHGDKLPSVVALLTNDMVQPTDPTQRISRDGRTAARAG